MNNKFFGYFSLFCQYSDPFFIDNQILAQILTLKKLLICTNKACLWNSTTILYK